MISRIDLDEAIRSALQTLRSGNALEPPGTPTDTAERGAIYALEALRQALLSQEG